MKTQSPAMDGLTIVATDQRFQVDPALMERAYERFVAVSLSGSCPPAPTMCSFDPTKASIPNWW